MSIENLEDRVLDTDKPYVHVVYNGGEAKFIYEGTETDPVDIAGEVWDEYSAFGVGVYANPTEYAHNAPPLAVADHKGNVFNVPATDAT